MVNTLPMETQCERNCRDRLHRLTEGQVEVKTPVGNIDILTKSEVIEVKTAKHWKSALGQVLVYGAY